MGKSRALAPLFALAMCVAAEPAATAEEFRIAEVRALDAPVGERLHFTVMQARLGLQHAPR